MAEKENKSSNTLNMAGVQSKINSIEMVTEKTKDNIQKVNKQIKQMLQSIERINQKLTSINNHMIVTNRESKKTSGRLQKITTNFEGINKNAVKFDKNMGTINELLNDVKKSTKNTKKGLSKLGGTQKETKCEESETDGDNKKQTMGDKIENINKIFEKFKKNPIGNLMVKSASDAMEQVKNKYQIDKLLGFDKEKSGVLLESIKDRATNSIFSINQVTEAYEKFLKTTKNTNELDALYNLTERLGTFNYFEKDGFDSVSKAMDDLLAGKGEGMASVLGMQQANFDKLGITELFKSGNVAAGISQLEALMESMGYTEEAAKNMAKNPMIIWNQFTENLKAKFSDAMLVIFEKIIVLSEAGVFDWIVGMFDRILLGVDWLIGAFSTIGQIVSSNWNTISPIIETVAIALGILITVFSIGHGILAGYQFVTTAIAAAKGLLTTVTLAETIAQHGLNAALFACPIVWIISAILILITLLIYWSDATGYVVSAMVLMAVNMYNQFVFIWNTIAMVAEFFVNVWKNPTYAVAKLIWDLKNLFLGSFANILEGVETFAGDFMKLINGAINIAIVGINGLIGAFNSLFGTDFGTVQLLDTENIHSASQAIRDMIGEKPTTDADVWEAPRKSEISYSFAGQAGFEAGHNFSQGIKDGISDFFTPNADIEGITSNDELGLGSFDNIQTGIAGISDINDNITNLPEAMPGSVDNPANMQEVDISEESIALMRDVANMRFVQNFVTVTPDVKFGDVTVHETADYRRFADGLVNELEQGLQIAASGVHG